jgi:hypothetical protein
MAPDRTPHDSGLSVMLDSFTAGAAGIDSGKAPPPAAQQVSPAWI